MWLNHVSVKTGLPQTTVFGISGHGRSSAIKKSWSVPNYSRVRQRWARTFADIMVTDAPIIRRMHALDPVILRKVRIDMIHGVVELMDSAAERVPQVPTPVLIQYGERDDIIPTPAVCALFDRLRATPRSGRWLALYPEGYHYLTRDLQRERTIRDILAWLAAPGAAPQSGAGVSPEAANRRLCGTAVDEARAHPRS